MRSHSTFGWLSAFIAPFIGWALIWLTNLAKRDREVDSAGNPSLRMWSTCVLGVIGGCLFLWFTLKHLGDPFYQRHPENIGVDVFFCVFGFLVAAWGCYSNITLTDTAITARYLPFIKRVYPIADVKAVDPLGKDTATI